MAKEGRTEAGFRKAIGADSIEDDGYCIVIRGYEINYAEWGEVEDILNENLIPYDKTWDAGGGFSAGESYVRLINGEMQELEFHEEETRLVQFLRDVKDVAAEEIKGRCQEEYQRLFPGKSRSCEPGYGRFHRRAATRLVSLRTSIPCGYKTMGLGGRQWLNVKKRRS